MELKTIYNNSSRYQWKNAQNECYVVDNIDWNYKDLDSPETHSILILNDSDDNEPSRSIQFEPRFRSDDNEPPRSIQLEPNYNFSRKEHFSLKAEKTILRDIKFKRGMPKLILSIGEENENTE